MKERFYSIPLSQRGNILFLEQCRVERNGNNVTYIKVKDGFSVHYNIPYINTSILFLGKGTSITQGAMELLAQQGVHVAFTSGHGFPLLSGTSPNSLIFSSFDEYRPVEYNHKFAECFLNEEKRLQKGKELLYKRVELNKKFFRILYDREKIIDFSPVVFESNMEKFLNEVDSAQNVMELLNAEERYVKSLYAFFAKYYDINNFKRITDEKELEEAPYNVKLLNDNLTHMNYITYGVATAVLYTLGISHSFSFLHGKTRRGALVFDIADLIKDSLALSYAFWGYKNNILETRLKYELIDFIFTYDVFKILLKEVKNFCP